MHQQAHRELELQETSPIQLTDAKKADAIRILEHSLNGLNKVLNLFVNCQVGLDSIKRCINHSLVITCVDTSTQHLNKNFITYTLDKSSKPAVPVFSLRHSEINTSQDAKNSAEAIIKFAAHIRDNLFKHADNGANIVLQAVIAEPTDDKLVHAGIFDPPTPKRTYPIRANTPSPQITPLIESNAHEDDFQHINTPLAHDFPRLNKSIPLFGNTPNLWLSLSFWGFFRRVGENHPPERFTKFRLVKYGLQQIRGLLMMRRIDQQKPKETSLIMLLCYVSNLLNTHRNPKASERNRDSIPSSAKQFARLLLMRHHAYFRRIILEDAYALTHKQPENSSEHALHCQAKELFQGFHEYNNTIELSDDILSNHRDGRLASTNNASSLLSLLRSWGKIRYIIKHHPQVSREKATNICRIFFHANSPYTRAPLVQTSTGNRLVDYARANEQRYKAEIQMAERRGERP